MDNRYSGMTVNERLCVSGLIKKFDKAVNKRDAEKIRSILKKVELTEENILPTLEKYGLD